MLERIFLTLFVLAVSIGGGAASVWYVLGTQQGIGALSVGSWTAFPKIGTPEADPYSKARIAREGVLSLGRAEGLTFIAERDSEGRPLRRDCSYNIVGSTPPARFWTLFAADKSLVVLNVGEGRLPAIHSQEILRQADNSFAIAFGPHPAAGNWVRVNGAGPMTFLLTLYDTPIETSTGIDGIVLPQVTRTVCDG
ncbi:MAG TPA: DUF1214 domain-containing protein [Rhizobiaceae bacterium]|nr:DUF1214 domain-containing protein [Rhizobiaceae bacterium]